MSTETEETICEECFLYKCCCEADREEDEKDKEDEIGQYHSAKIGSRLFRKIMECPCPLHGNKPV